MCVAEVHVSCRLQLSLGRFIDKRDDPDGDMQNNSNHIVRSNKPSSLIMMSRETCGLASL